MKVAYQLLLLSLQAGLTFIVLLGVYLLLALLDYRGGVPAFISLVAFQPLMGALLSLATMSVCVLVGLPLRLAACGRWWRQRAVLALVGAAVGAALLVASLFVRATTPPPALPAPSVLVLASSGWFLLAFSLLHVFPPDTLLHRLGLFGTQASK